MNKRFAYLLICSLALSQLSVTSLATTQQVISQTANIELTLNLEYPVIKNQNIDLKAILLKENQVIHTMTLDEMTLSETPETNGTQCYGVFSDLPLGTYQIRLEGKGYKAYTSEDIQLDKSEKHLVIDGGKNTFTLGDTNQDGRLDDVDLQLVENALGTNVSKNDSNDFNGDEKVDIEDLAQLYWSQNSSGETKIYNTKTILSSVVESKEVLKEIQLANGKGTVIQGDINNLFIGNGETSVSIQPSVPITDTTPVRIPLSFTEEVEVSEITIMAPEAYAPTAGYVVYEENGEEIKQAFTSVETYTGVARQGTQKHIKINLGKQVPLQKITIEVTETNAENGLLTAISKIEFLEDIVDQAVNQEQGVIKNFTGKALNEGVSLSWNKTANVTEYKIQYGTEPGVYKETSYTKDNYITIEGLENLTPYYFVVQAINGNWTGPLSKEIKLIPEPQNKPSSPTEVNVAGFDKGIKVTYRLGTDALSANIYYKRVNEAQYTKVENTYSGKVIRGLENNQEYMIYVTAENSAGESIPSTVMRSTPKEEVLIIPEIPTVGRIDNSHITDIQLIDPVNVAEKYYPDGFSAQNVIDEDFTTHWTAATYQRARGVIVTFDQPYEMDYVAFTPRLDSDLDRYDGTRKYWHYPHFYSIRVWETLDSEPKDLIIKDTIPKIGKDGLMILPFEKTKIAKIQVQIYEWDGAGASSISEVMFYEYQDFIERVDSVFANDLYTEVKPGVTVEEIDQLLDELEALEGAVLWVDKEILKEELMGAKELLTKGQLTNVGEILEVVQTRQSSTAQAQNFAAGGLSELQAAGVMAYAGDEILVYVDAPKDGNMPELVASQFYGDATWSKKMSLKPGRNVIQVPEVVNYQTTKGGPLYVTYTGEIQDTTTVRIVHAQKIPALELTSLEDEVAVKEEIQKYIIELTDYVANLNLTHKTKDPANVTEIGTDKVLLSLPAEEVYRGLTSGIQDNQTAQVERLYESLMTWEENIKLHYAVLGLEENASQGIHAYPKSRFNVRYMPMNNGVFMYAAGDHIGIQYNSGAGLVQGNREAETGYFGWGINHEIGHIINDKKFVVSETSNNIFSLFAQTINGGKSRLEIEDVYSKIYDKVVSKNTGLASNVFVNLGMFWQLHLAYDESVTGIEIEDFYPTLHRLSRTLNLDDLDAINYFIRVASQTVEKDLTPFFERWGMHILDETRAFTSQYESEERALYYLNDEAMRYRLNGGTGMVEGSSANITATTDGQKVTLTLASDMESDALLGYEIYRDNELIAFTTEDTYVDEVAANNVSYTYSVVAYDKLLSSTDKVSSEEVYIAAEGTISKTEYELQRTTAGSLQIVLPNAPEVVGLKFSDITTEGDKDYTVEVSQDGENWVVAKQSTLKSGTTLVYFNKPGVTEADDRIWTYDAQYIRITGKNIGDLEDDQIDVLAYPGDSVHFTEGAIGYLGADYDFGKGIIEKDTLVVMGTYRGHPIYSKIVLSANYVNEKDFDESERPGYRNEQSVDAVEGELYMFAEVPEDGEVSKVGNGIWLFVPKAQTLPSQIKANLFRTDEAESTEGGRLVSDTKWLLVPSTEDMPTIELE